MLRQDVKIVTAPFLLFSGQNGEWCMTNGRGDVNEPVILKVKHQGGKFSQKHNYIFSWGNIRVYATLQFWQKSKFKKVIADDLKSYKTMTLSQKEQ